MVYRERHDTMYFLGPFMQFGWPSAAVYLKAFGAIICYQIWHDWDIFAHFWLPVHNNGAFWPLPWRIFKLITCQHCRRQLLSAAVFVPFLEKGVLRKK